jgi:serine/threonine protein kinase
MGKFIYMLVSNLRYSEIFDYVSETGWFDESVARFYYWQLISALEYMHQNSYYHRDLKLENILIDEQFNLKLADFGFTSRSKISKSCKGTYGYMAPEIIERKEYEWAQADLFASAVILFILLCQNIPFDRAQYNDMHYRKIMNNDWVKFWGFYDHHFSEQFKDLFKSMVHPDPIKRLNLQQIKDHPWFNGTVATHEEVYSDLWERHKVIAIKSTKLSEYKNLSKPSSECDEDDAMTSESKDNTKKIMDPIKTRYTQLFNANDGDQILDAVIEIANQKGYNYDKSEEYFQITLFVSEEDKKATISVHVLKSQKTNNNNRWLKCMLIDGDTKVFNKCFATVKQFVEENFA